MRGMRSGNFMNPVTGIIYILCGQDGNCTEKEVRKQNFTIFCRRICNRDMILREDRDTKFGIDKIVLQK
jgi:hypothetical protein